MPSAKHKHALQMPTWVPAFRLCIPGIPIAKGRHRCGCRNNKVVTYSDKKTDTYEKSVAWHAAAQTRGKMIAPAGVPVRVDVLAFYPKPQRLKHIKGTLPKCNKQFGDADNHLKAILDGLTKAGIWADDGQACCLRVEPLYTDERPRSEVSVFLPSTLATGLVNTTTEENENGTLASRAAGIDCGHDDGKVVP